MTNSTQWPKCGSGASKVARIQPRLRCNCMNITTLPFPRFAGTKHAKDFVLPEDCWFEQWDIPAGTTVKLVTSQNFGIVVLPAGTKDKTGYVMHRHIFRW